jgi:hypothetical protein
MCPSALEASVSIDGYPMWYVLGVEPGRVEQGRNRCGALWVAAVGSDAKTSGAPSQHQDHRLDTMTGKDPCLWVSRWCRALPRHSGRPFLEWGMCDIFAQAGLVSRGLYVGALWRFDWGSYRRRRRGAE